MLLKLNGRPCGSSFRFPKLLAYELAAKETFIVNIHMKVHIGHVCRTY